MTRDLLKTASFAALHFGVGFGVTYALTGSLAVATGVALLEPSVKAVENALEPFGARLSDYPLKPSRLVEIVRESGRAAAG